MGELNRAQRDSFNTWLADINLICGAFTGETTGDGFSGAIEEHRQGALKMSFVKARQARLLRQQSEVAKGDTHSYFAVFQLEGSTRMIQGAASETLSAGEIMFIDNTQPSEFTYSATSRQLSLILPHDLLNQTLKHTHIKGGCKISTGVTVANLATQLLLATREQGALSLNESEAVLESVISLLRPALTHAAARQDPHERVFRRSLELIDRYIRDTELSPELLAHETGISVRGLYRVFGKNGLVVAQYIKNRRLDLCAETLRHGASSEKLAAIAYTWGFSNSSYFTTAFKARFGVSPSEYRKRYP